MNVLGLFNDANLKKQPPDTIVDLIVQTELALTTLFRDIAAEKNQMLNSIVYNDITPAAYQAAIIKSAQHLAEQLNKLVARQTGATPNGDLIGNIRALDQAIIAFQHNEQLIAQLLLVGSSIKLCVEKILIVE